MSNICFFDFSCVNKQKCVLLCKNPNTMKRLLLFFSLFISVSIIADDFDYPCQKQITRGDFAKAEKDITKKLSKSPGDIAYLYAASQLYLSASNPGRDIERAYNFACRGADSLASATEKEKTKLEKKGFTPQLFKTAIRSCCSAARTVAENDETTEGYIHFLNTYTRCDKDVESQMILRRNKAAFRDASAVNTIAAYEAFINSYPKADQVTTARNRIYDMAYKDAVSAGTPAALTEYINRYPESTRLLAALNLLRPQPYKENEITVSNWQEYQSAAKISRNSVIPAALTQRTLMRLALKTLNYSIAQYGYSNFAQPMRDSCWLVLHRQHTSTGLSRDIQKLYLLYPNSTFTELTKHDEEVIEAARAFFVKKEMSSTDFIRIAAPYNIAYDVLVTKIAESVKAQDWEACISYCEPFADVFAGDSKYECLMSTLRREEEPIVKQRLNDSINTIDGKEYLPVTSADGQTIYFVGSKRDDSLGGEDIFISRKDTTGEWGHAHLLEQLNTVNGNEGVQSVSVNGASLIVFSNGKLMTTNRTADGWSALTPLPDNINISRWQCDAMITSDGKAMLFSAQVPAAHERDTSVNIFVSLLDSVGNWGVPFDLGPTINTSYSDRSPFLHPDMKTLYFSSSGHGTLGNMDVFKSTRLNDDSWTEWSEPVNIGRQLNTAESDWGYRFTTDGKSAYFSDGKDIYNVDMPVSMRPNAVATISGRVIDGDSLPVKVKIRWEDLDSHSEIGESETDASDGSFFLVLPLGRLYGYYIDDDRYYPLSNNIDLRDITEMITINKELQLVSYKQMMEEGTAVQVNNLFFPVNEWELLPQSENELLRVAEIIKMHNFNVEISGHTDSSGDAARNRKLSQQRADSVRDFLIRQGCDADRLTAKGYGASKPVADNNTEEGKQRNRRVELQFVK